MSVITRNVALKYMERKQKVSFVSIAEEENIMDTDAASDSIVNRQDVLKLIDELPNGYGKVFRLYTIYGFSHKEIANILGIKPHSSSSQLSRAKAMLQKMMGYRNLAVILFLIMAIPLYFFVLREKLLQSQKLEIAENDRRKKDMDTTKRIPKSAEEKNDVQKPIRKKMVVPDVNEEKQDTVRVPDTSVVEIFVPDIQVAEYEQDNTEEIDSIIPLLTFPDYEFAKEDIKKSNKWQMLAAGSLGPALA